MANKIYGSVGDVEKAAGSLTQYGDGIFTGSRGGRYKLGPGGYEELEAPRLPPLPSGPPVGDSKEAQDYWGRVPTYGEGGKTYYGGFDSYGVKQPIEEQIRDEKRKAAQAKIDLINQEAARKISEENVAEEKALARRRSISVLSGLGGSPDAEAKKEEISVISRKNRDIFNAEAASKIEMALNDADSAANLEYEAQLKENREEREALLKQATEKATSVIQSVASIGLSMDDFKTREPQLFESLKRQSGLTEYQLQAIYNAAIPESKRPITADSVILGENGNAYVQRVSFNPVTKKTETMSFDTGVLYAMYKDSPKIETKDGRILVPDGNGGYKELLPLSEKEKAEIEKLKAEAAKARGEAGLGAGFSGPVSVTIPTTSTIASKHNNPGNLIFVGQPGAAKGDPQMQNGKPTGQYWAKFDSPEAGYQAMVADLTAKQKRNLSIDQFVDTYASSSPATERESYKEALAAGLGLKRTDSISAADTNQLAMLVAKQESGSSAQSVDFSGQYEEFLSGLPETGKQVFNNLNETDKSNLKQLIEGDVLISDLATGMKGAETRKKYLALAQQIEPGFSENTNKSRFNFRKNWDNPQGKAYATRNSINTAIGHLAQLKENSLALDNKTLNKYNSIANMVKKEVGNPAVTNFNYTLDVLAAELASVYKNGTAPTDQETKEMRNAISAAYSPAQIAGLIDNAAYLLASKITSTGNEYKSVMQRYPDDPLVQEYVLEELKRAGVDTSRIDKVIEMQRNEKMVTDPETQPVGSVFVYNGRKVRKVGEDNYEFVQ